MKPETQEFAQSSVNVLTYVRAVSFATFRGEHSRDWERVSKESIANPKNADLFIEFYIRCNESVAQVWFDGQQYVSSIDMVMTTADRNTLIEAAERWLEDDDQIKMGFKGLMKLGPGFINHNALYKT